MQPRQNRGTGRAGWANDRNLAGRAVESHIRPFAPEHKVQAPKVNLSRCNNPSKSLILRIRGRSRGAGEGFSPPALSPIVLQRHGPHYAGSVAVRAADRPKIKA